MTNRRGRGNGKGCRNGVGGCGVAEKFGGEGVSVVGSSVSGGGVGHIGGFGKSFG